MPTLWHQSGINRKGEPFVQLLLDSEVICQLDPAEARDHAKNILEAAEASEQDAFIRSFAMEEIGCDDEAAMRLIQAFRRWREARGKKGPPSDPREFVVNDKHRRSKLRTLTDHITNAVNEGLTITVTDEPGQGGANHKYAISWKGVVAGGPDSTNYINFQNGPIKEVGVNGITQEALLAVVIDRLRSFQKGPFSCRENAIALTHCEDALLWLQKRTRERMARGVEGTTAA